MWVLTFNNEKRLDKDEQDSYKISSGILYKLFV